MARGIIEFLTGSNPAAIVLRQNFVFKVVPMLNPDGVINGNTRVNLAGWDLNRKWAFPIEKLFPTIYHLKNLILSLQLESKVAIFCDLHGHSIHKDIFMYGCYRHDRKMHRASADPRIFPMLVVGGRETFTCLG